MVNEEFARKVFGSADRAIGRSYKMKDGTRIQVVGIAEDGKYNSLTEDPVAGDVSSRSFNRPPPRPCWWCARGPVWTMADSRRRSHEGRFAATGYGVAGFHRNAGQDHWISSLVWSAHGNHLARCAGRDGRDAFHYRHLWHGGVFGKQAAQGTGNPCGARRATQGSAAGCAGAGVQVAWRLVRRQDCFWDFLATRVLAFIVYEATPRDPLVLAGVVLAMALLGLVATWIPAQRALSVNPLVLLRED